eukprot:scaffold564422_cov20-Prasinocladus_malaysianus.AAC.1
MQSMLLLLSNHVKMAGGLHSRGRHLGPLLGNRPCQLVAIQPPVSTLCNAIVMPAIAWSDMCQVGKLFVYIDS